MRETNMTNVLINIPTQGDISYYNGAFVEPVITTNYNIYTEG